MLRRKVDVTGFKEEVERLRRSRLAVILLVYFALVMDNMLLTVVVPIIPDYLYQMEYQQTEKRDEEKLIGPNLQSTSNTSPLSSSFGNQQLENSVTSAKTQSDYSSNKQPLKGSQESTSGTHDGRASKQRFTESRYPTASSAGSRNQMSVQSGVSLATRASFPGRPPDTEKSAGPVTLDRSGHDGSTSPNNKEMLKEGMLQNLKNGIDMKLMKLLKRNDETVQVPLAEKNNFSTVVSGTQRVSQSSAHNASTVLKPSTDVGGSNGTNHTPVLDSTDKGPTPRAEWSGNSADAPQNKTLHNTVLPQDIINENSWVGLLFSSKAFVQLIVNPFIGPLTSRIGYSLPLLVGTQNLIISALLFAYAESYTLLFVARSIQGIASSCIAISGMGIIAECYPEDKERGRMQGMVMGGIALGVLAGYPIGGLLYDFTSSKTPPFLLVAVLTAILALIQLAVLNPRPSPERLIVATPLSGLIRDPFILITAGAVMVSTLAMAMLEPCLPIWLTDTLHPQKWQLGTVFIPDSIGYLVGTSCTAGSSYRIGRWRAALIAMMMVAFASATVPEARSMLALAGPHFFLGMGVGTVDAAMMPLLAAIVDARHVAAYGAVYSIAQAAVALAYGFGPLVGGAVVRQIGFPWLMRGVAILNLCYCPLLFILTTFNHDPSESQAILMAAPDPNDYTSHTTASVQPREASLRYQQLFHEEDD
ncbi:synaptic vesicular amine transporter-like [Macrobrachium nipponense]|uniref:synaptic vesicular amine transporter-like n=1 Tax=Macrobrachium nipponense TaxID=159736 RepID=UPI0030C85A6D